MLYSEMPPLKVFPVGTPIEDVDIVDRGQHMVFHCKIHPTQLWSSKQPFVSRWFGRSDTEDDCTHQFQERGVYVLAEEYKPVRND